MFIKRKLFPLVFKGFEILQSFSLKWTWDEAAPRPLSVKTSKTSTCGREGASWENGRETTTNFIASHFPST